MGKVIKIGRFRILFAKSPPLLKFAIAAALAVCTAAVLTLGILLAKEQMENKRLKQQSVAYAQENSDLRRWLADAGTEKSIRRIAESELGLVDPGSRFFTPEN